MQVSVGLRSDVCFCYSKLLLLFVIMRLLLLLLFYYTDIQNIEIVTYLSFVM